MVNHPGGGESGSGVFGFFQSDLQTPFPVQLDLKKVALFGISLTTHFYPSPDPQQKYQPATEATPQESLGDRARSPAELCTTPLSSFLRPGRRNKTRVVALRDPATMVSPSATTRRPKGTVTHPRAHLCGTPSVRRGGFLPKSASLGSHSSALPSRCPVILTNILYYLYHPHIILYN